jgi:gas vesicle protein
MLTIQLFITLKNMYMNNTGKILTGIAAGAAAGVVLGVLFAPDKGSETRRKISEKGTGMADNIKDRITKGKEKLHGLK